jgi:AbiV family abortive infection protein
MPEPGLDGWQELMEAAARNARDLVADARLLLEAGRLPRAYALAELAAEEIGKLMMLAAVAVRVAMDDPVDLERFWRKFRDHDRKAMNAVFWDHIAMADPVAFMARGPSERTARGSPPAARGRRWPPARWQDL